MKRITIVILSFVALSGCSDQFRGGEGEESLRIVNEGSVAAEVIARIRAQPADIEVFRADVALAPGESRTYVLALPPGKHLFAITTTTKIDERFMVEVPTRGDTHWTLTLVRGGATLSRA